MESIIVLIVASRILVFVVSHDFSLKHERMSGWVLHGQTPLKLSLMFLFRLFLKDMLCMWLSFSQWCCHYMVTWMYYSQTDVTWVKCSANVWVGCNDSLDCFTLCMWKPDGEKSFRCVGKHAGAQNLHFWIDMNWQNDSLMHVLIWIILQKLFFFWNATECLKKK